MNKSNVLLPTLLTLITFFPGRAEPPVTAALTLLGHQSVSRDSERLEGPPVHVCWKLDRSDVMYLYQNEAALTRMFQSGSGREMMAHLKKVRQGDIYGTVRDSVSLADSARGGVERERRPIHVPVSFAVFTDRDASHYVGVKIGGREFVGEARRPRQRARRQRIVNNAANGNAIPLVQGIVDGIYEDKKTLYISRIQGRIHEQTSQLEMGRDQVTLSADHPIGYGELVVLVDGTPVWREPNTVVWQYFEQAQARDFSFIEDEVRKVIESRVT